MASQPPSQRFGIDQYPPRSVQLLPPPPRSGESQQQSLRRSHAANLPSLTTALPPGSVHSPLPTPLSTTSLSSPFTASHPRSYSPSPATASRGVSPMSSRMAAYNMPYNPSEWASGSRRPSDIDYERANPDEGLVAPPPPYSAPTNQSSVTASRLVTSPAEIQISPGIPSRNNTPTGSGVVVSPMFQAGHSNRESVVSMGRGLPPPPPRNSGHDSRRSSAFPSKARPMSVASMSQVMSFSSTSGQDSHHRQDSTASINLPGPPAAKRAASTGAVSFTESSAPQSREPSQSRSASRNRAWQPGMPLPGPPPGLPPSASRSNSANNLHDDARRVSPGPSTRTQPRRVPLHAPILSPMPPTPADWTDDQPMRPSTRATVPLSIVTRNLGPNLPSKGSYPMSEPVGEPSSSTRPAGALSRSSALRDSSAKGLRERRNLRKSLHGSDMPDLSALSVNTNPWADAMASAASATASPTVFSDSPTHNQGEADSSMTSPVADRPSHSRSTSQANSTKPKPVDILSPGLEGAPRSPMLSKIKSPAVLRGPMQVQPKTLPTPPLSQKAPMSGRSVVPSSTSSLPDFENTPTDKFASDSLLRYQDFLRKESQVDNDVERFQLFADYLAVESVLRQKRYTAALLDGQIDLDATRRRLFNETDHAVQSFFQQHRATDTPVTSVSSNPDDGRQRPESMWWAQYQPALSPIASMSNDEMSSRGRTSSRWWESQPGSQTDGGTNKIRRSKRESKYMGLSTALMQSTIDESDTQRNVQYDQILKDDEYPEEKANAETFGMYTDEEAPISRPNSLGQQPSPNLLDVSRLITLPPPYPRHYPGVNNAHPSLASYRLTVRGLSELGEIKARKSRHSLSVEALRTQHKQKIADGRKAFKVNVQAQIGDGTITYAEAAEAEEVLRMDERQIEKESLQAEFDNLQDVLISPLHDMLNDRLVQLSNSINELTEKLFLDAQDQNPDRPQQEGDDMPELLEYLTQLKWMFETREQIYREIFDLLTERNNKYKAIVVLPYQQANNVDKVRDTEAFFAQDNLDRHRVFCEESLHRHDQFFNIVEDNVARGVELQSSAFWDIAPNLLEVLQHMPADATRMDVIAIPEQEYLENPSYHRYPQQYVYTLLDHAEKSTYQFIESQINLHCLLHEIKSSVLLARCRKMEAERSVKTQRSPTTPSISEYRSNEENTLTAELKQKVSLIEEQWLEALGSQLQGTRERVKTYLEDQGAWEEMVRDEE